MSEQLFQPEREQEIAQWLKQVKFRKRVFGGIDEADVWKKIGELNDRKLFARMIYIAILLTFMQVAV